MIHEKENPQDAKVSARISLCGMLRLIRVYTLRRVHNVGFLVERLSEMVDSNQCFFFIDWDTVQGQPNKLYQHCAGMFIPRDYL